MQERRYPEIGERILTTRLGNGLTINVVPKTGFKKAFAMLSVHYGSIDARFQTAEGIVVPPYGVAHFLEHKVFEQPDGGNALQAFASTGASPNAFTSKNMTAYHFSCTEHLHRNLEILFDFVTTPHFTDENVAKEQGIIEQEIGMVNGDPQFKVYENLMHALYEKHPAKDSIIGTTDSIHDITRGVLYDCYNTFYTPSNMALTVCGDVDAQAIAEIADNMTVSENRTLPLRDYGVEPDAPFVNEISENMECNLPIFAIGFKMNAETGGERGMKLRLIAELTADLIFGTSSPLYAELYRDGLINREFGAQPMFFPGSVAFMISGESRDPEEVRKRVLAWTADISDEFLRRVKHAQYGMRLRYFDYFDSLCRQIADGTQNGYDYLNVFSLFLKIEKDDIINFAHELLSEKRMAVSTVLPK
ncbi:MAG: pitrilysin family protein [Clostridia bacterium]